MKWNVFQLVGRHIATQRQGDFQSFGWFHYEPASPIACGSVVTTWSTRQPTGLRKALTPTVFSTAISAVGLYQSLPGGAISEKGHDKNKCCSVFKKIWVILTINKGRL
jgi:hypothetical protein